MLFICFFFFFFSVPGSSKAILLCGSLCLDRYIVGVLVVLSFIYNCFSAVLQQGITKTYLYNFNPLKPHFYIVKLGFTGVYIIFLILLKNIDCEYSLEPPRRDEAVLTSTHNLCFEQKYEKYQIFLSENFQFLVVKFSIYLNRRVFVMALFGEIGLSLVT